MALGRSSTCSLRCTFQESAMSSASTSNFISRAVSTSMVEIAEGDTVWDDDLIAEGEVHVSTQLQQLGDYFDPYDALRTPLFRTDWVKQPSATEGGPDDSMRNGNRVRHTLERSYSKLQVADRPLCVTKGIVSPKKKNRNGYSRPPERTRAIKVDVGKHSQRARAAKEAVAVLQRCLQRGITVDANMYLDALQRCFKQKDLESAKQVHYCIKSSGMEQNPYVANYLLKVYIRCDRLQDARKVFDKLEEKNVFNWTSMIGGYAEYDHANDAFDVYNQMRQEGGQPNEITYLSILKACASPGGLQSGKGIHAHIRLGGFQSDVRVGTALVNMYAKSGSIDDARLIFKNMVERNVISWNAMIGGLAHQGYGQEAFLHFLQMQKEGFVPNSATYLSILNASAPTGTLGWVKDVHRHAVKAGLASDVRVGSALVNMYAKSGRIDDARLVFDRMSEHSLSTWNSMIGGLAQHGRGHEAFTCFLQMQEDGFCPDVTTYLSILSANASASKGALEWVKGVHSHAVQAGLASDLRVGNALVHMYCKSGSIDDAKSVFDEMGDRDVVTWNALIGGFAQDGCGQEAFTLFLQMQREGLVPDAITYVSLLNKSASTGALEWVKDVHKHAVEDGLAFTLRVGSAFIQMYINSGSIDSARLVFNQMEERDTISWTLMIGGLTQRGFVQEAFSFVLQMQREGFVPNPATCVAILDASGGALELVKEVHSHVVKTGLNDDLRVGNALIHAYLKSGRIDVACLTFDKMVERNVTSWNSMVGGLVQLGCEQQAFSLFLHMQKERCVPNVSTILGLLSASAMSLEWVKEVHSHADKAGLASDLRVASALVHSYAKSGSIDDAREVFNNMNERNVISWTGMIGGLAQHGRGREALKLLEAMKSDGVSPNGYSFVAVLSACSHAGLVDEGRRQFKSMTQDYGIEPTIEHYTCMVDLLGRAGHLEEAKLFVLSMPVEPGSVPWGALLSACRTYGNVEVGLLAAKEHVKLNPMDAKTYILLSNIYAAAGQWDQVTLVRSMMEGKGLYKEPGRSWIEVDKTIHRFVAGDASHPEAEEIYAELNLLNERLRAEGYVPNTRIVLRNFGEEAKELALCSHSERLAIAYGLMRLPPGKTIRVFKNLRMCSDCHTATKFISKVTRREIVAKDAYRFHHFTDGVCSCGDYW